jgi:cyclic pyranopterin phosphate synthase
VTPPLVDTLGRPIRDLRVSVTDRCNFRCVDCMPKEVYGPGHAFLERAELLSFEEITRLARVFAGLGVRKLRLTGGEPLVRRDLPALVAMLAGIGGLDVTLTTNGSLLDRHAGALRAAGLARLTVSLDSLDDEVFRRMNDVGAPVATVLEGIAAAERAGFTRLKINMVVKRGVNDASIVPMARRFRGTGHVVRFIEYMDVGTTNGWRMDDVVSASEIVAAVHREFPLEPTGRAITSDTAETWRYADGGGEIGVVASVTRAFCRDCVRARLSANGSLYTCLFATRGHDLKALVRSGAPDDALAAEVARVWSARGDRYSELRGAATSGLPRVEMSYIGG